MMGEFRNLLQDNSLDGWKIYPRGILQYTPGTEEYENAPPTCAMSFR